MSKRPLRMTPGTTWGKWSVVFTLIMPILFVIGSSLTGSLYESTPAGGTILKDIGARPVLALTMLTGMAAGIGAFFLGFRSIIRQREHALLVYVSTVIGALLLLFLAGEIVFPH